MFGHDYSDKEREALNAIREHELFGSISPAGLHNDWPAPSSYEDDELDIDYKQKYLEEKQKNNVLRRKLKVKKK